FYREFTLTVSAVVDEFGYSHCSDTARQLYDDTGGANRTRELIIAHSIEPNNDGRGPDFGFSDRFALRDLSWESGGPASPQGFTTSGKPGIASVYDTKFPVAEISEDIKEVQLRLGKTFFNDVLMTASQFETRSNVTAVEWNMRKSESMVALGPAIDRIDWEVLSPALDRIFGIAVRA